MSTRRKFLYNSAAIAGGTMLASAMLQPGFAYFRNSIMPSDQVRIGAIGINGMGWANLTAALKVPGVTVAAICDIDQSVIDKRLADLQKMGINTSTVKCIVIIANYSIRKILMLLSSAHPITGMHCK